MAPSARALLGLVLTGLLGCGGKAYDVLGPGGDDAGSRIDSSTDCNPAACPQDGTPAELCPDKSIRRRSCVHLSPDVCGWQDLPCPGEEGCGGAAGVACPGGSYCKYPRCPTAPGTTGTCAPIPEACASISDWVCGCDGAMYPNACLAAQAKQTVASKGACGSCVFGGACPSPTAFCKVPAGTCSGAGTCTPRPTLCPDLYQPVCGCDHKTYGNSCEAETAGVSVARTGECANPTPVKTCGGFRGTPCAADEWCDYPDSLCGAADGTGVCQKRPTACPFNYAPVCGCDGKTHGNACDAHGAGVDDAYAGPCK